MKKKYAQFNKTDRTFAKYEKKEQKFENSVSWNSETDKIASKPI